MDVDFGEAQTWTPLFTHKLGLIELVAGFGFDGPSKGGYQSPFGGSNSDRPFKFAGAIFSPASNSTNHQVK
ncbi:Tyrosine-protein kinase Yes [Trichinella spiralis]|uniref:Tyrosine-protein kinase Yes n=1 Tax=Trichinella spiralis TaxID=6334 RepID=A0ABR3KW44_TRISP